MKARGLENDHVVPVREAPRQRPRGQNSTRLSFLLRMGTSYPWTKSQQRILNSESEEQSGREEAAECRRGGDKSKNGNSSDLGGASCAPAGWAVLCDPTKQALSDTPLPLRKLRHPEATDLAVAQPGLASMTTPSERERQRRGGPAGGPSLPEQGTERPLGTSAK